jgi:predicted amidohydrolase YtcJ
VPSRRVEVVVAALAVGFAAPPMSGGTVVAAAESVTVPADLVVVNGDLITMASESARATALAVSDGLVVAVGDDAAMEALIGENTRVVDLGGATAIPGLVDAHSHFFEAGVRQGIGAEIQDTEILSNGITTTAEFHTGPELVETMRRYVEADELRVRTSLYLIYTDACGDRKGDWWKAYAPTRDAGEMLRIGGIKVFADGGACNVPAVSYSYVDGSSGDLYFDVDEMESVIREIEGQGHQAAVHALGDRAVAVVLEAMERVIGDRGNPLRHRIEHNAVVGPDLYGRHQQSGVIATLLGAFRTCFVTDENNDYRFRTPDEFVSWEWPWRQLLDSNPETVFAWHVDYPALPATIGANLAGFVTRVEGDCRPSPDMAAGTITVEEALRLMTLGSAYALHREREVGSLEVGKYADLAVLSQNPLAVEPAQLESTEVLMTMVGGQIEFCHQAFAAVCGEPATTPPSEPPTSPVGCPPGADNVALHAAATASSSLGDRPAAHAVDGDVETGWGAGAHPEQWIEVDLGQQREINCLRLLVDQYPAGHTIHRVNGGAHPDPGRQLGELDAGTEYGDWLELSGPWTLRYLRITTLESPSWVSWLEIEAY